MSPHRAIQVIAHPDRPVPFTPKVQKLMQLQSDEQIKDADKSDTTFSAGSLQAALRAAGAVIAAINAVLDGTHRNAFCCVRPPGHHAGANPCVPRRAGRLLRGANATIESRWTGVENRVPAYGCKGSYACRYCA